MISMLGRTEKWLYLFKNILVKYCRYQYDQNPRQNSSENIACYIRVVQVIMSLTML